MSKMVDRIAEAIEKALIDGECIDPHDYFETGFSVCAKEAARAAIAAMRELGLIICRIEAIGPGRLAYVPIDWPPRLADLAEKETKR